MRLKVTRQNISDDELTKALAGYIEKEGIEREVFEGLQKHDHGEEIPEKYIRTITRKLELSFKSLRMILLRNIDSWFAAQSKVNRKRFLRKSDETPHPNLSQHQIDELKQLIEYHFRITLGIKVTLPKTTQKRWKKIGVEEPHHDLMEWIQKSYVAGRLAEVLTNNSTYTEMMKLAKQMPMTRMDQLSLEAAQKNAAKYIKGYGTKLADLAEDMLTEQHKSNIHEVVQHYFSGELTHTLYNEEGFTPAEAEKLLSTDKRVKGWRELSTELKNRFKAVDANRDWDRVSVSEVRFATNLGRLTNIQIEGGGNPDEIEVYFNVQPTACKACKALYLHPDGTPKIFKLSEILNNVQETGGMNIGRKASLIGESGGYVPNALVHPRCHCYMVRVIPGYPIGGV